ncbi:MAG: hypothetical protein ACFFD2_26395, partial [Promethearchaeota archaeon]
WRHIPEAMEEYIKKKVLDYYLIDSLSDKVYNILKEKSYRFLIEEILPAPPEKVMEDMHRPEFIIRFNPQKGLHMEKIAPNREHYTTIANMILFKLKLSWEFVYRFEGFVEEWWVENANYLKNMSGFCIYERTKDNQCHYYSITVKVEPNETLAALGEMIIPTLEKMTKENTAIMMENIRKYYMERKEK